MRTYAIADLHGRFDLLAQAIQLIEEDAGSEPAKLVILGDFIDRGPHSAQIISRLMKGPTKPNWEWVILQGNHEEMMLQCISSPKKLQWWIRNGGGQTLMSYGYKQGDALLPWRIPVEHLVWLQELPVTHEDQWRIFVHAGVPHDTNIEDTPKQHLQWMLYRDGGEQFRDATYFDDERHISGKHIVHGHHQSESHPQLVPHRSNFDTFAWKTGRLAIGVFEDDYPAPSKVLEVQGPAYVFPED